MAAWKLHRYHCNARAPPIRNVPLKKPEVLVTKAEIVAKKEEQLANQEMLVKKEAKEDIELLDI